MKANGPKREHRSKLVVGSSGMGGVPRLSLEGGAPTTSIPASVRGSETIPPRKSWLRRHRKSLGRTADGRGRRRLKDRGLPGPLPRGGTSFPQGINGRRRPLLKERWRGSPGQGHSVPRRTTADKEREEFERRTSSLRRPIRPSG